MSMICINFIPIVHIGNKKYLLIEENSYINEYIECNSVTSEEGVPAGNDDCDRMPIIYIPKTDITKEIISKAIKQFLFNLNKCEIYDIDEHKINIKYIFTENSDFRYVIYKDEIFVLVELNLNLSNQNIFSEKKFLDFRDHTSLLYRHYTIMYHEEDLEEEREKAREKAKEKLISSSKNKKKKHKAQKNEPLESVKEENDEMKVENKKEFTPDKFSRNYHRRTPRFSEGDEEELIEEDNELTTKFDSFDDSYQNIIFKNIEENRETTNILIMLDCIIYENQLNKTAQ